MPKVSAQFEKMVEEFQKYRDMLKREREEFQKQLVRVVGTSWFLFISIEIDNIEWCKVEIS